MEHPTVAANHQHRLDDALGTWKRVKGGLYENFDGWKIAKNCNTWSWEVFAPNGEKAHRHGGWKTLQIAKLEAAQIIAAQPAPADRPAAEPQPAADVATPVRPDTAGESTPDSTAREIVSVMKVEEGDTILSPPHHVSASEVVVKAIVETGIGRTLRFTNRTLAGYNRDGFVTRVARAPKPEPVANADQAEATPAPAGEDQGDAEVVELDSRRRAPRHLAVAPPAAPVPGTDAGLVSILNGPAGRPIDPATVWRDHVGYRLRIELHARDLYYSTDYVQADIRRGHRLVIKLSHDDTYALEIGRMRRPRGEVLPEWTVRCQRRGIQAEALAEVLLEMATEVYGLS